MNTAIPPQTTAPMDDKALRKAWLKRKFASWEYHEELLSLHDEYLQGLHRHWGREDIQQQFPGFYRTMVTPVFFNFDKVSKPGAISKASWKKRKTAGESHAISYNFSRGLGDIGLPFDEYAGMDQATKDRLNVLVAKILHHCTNIRITVENRWDDDDEILTEKYTGPIDWPANWRDDVADLIPAATALRVDAGQPCPQEGFWFSPAQPKSRRYFSAGQLMPPLSGDYGATIWQWDEHQLP